MTKSLRIGLTLVLASIFLELFEYTLGKLVHDNLLWNSANIWDVFEAVLRSRFIEAELFCRAFVLLGVVVVRG